MRTILITGATGNVGIEVLKSLNLLDHFLEIKAEVRNVESDQKTISPLRATCIPFDFMDPKTFGPGFKDLDVLFLLRPPQISDVKKYFEPLIIAAKMAKSNILFFYQYKVWRKVPSYLIIKSRN